MLPPGCDQALHWTRCLEVFIKSAHNYVVNGIIQFDDEQLTDLSTGKPSCSSSASVTASAAAHISWKLVKFWLESA